MKILAVEEELQKLILEDESIILKNEAEQVHKLYLEGFIREIYFNEKHFAVIILECKDKEEAKNLLDELPLVKNKVIKFRLTELKPYTGFSRLFEK